MSKDSPDLELGDGIEVRWFINKDNLIAGGILSHIFPANPSGRCEGSFTLRGMGSGEPEWDMIGSFDSPTLAPSLLCHCGFHGFIQNGKWVNA